MARIRIDSAHGRYVVVCSRGAIAHVRELVTSRGRPSEIFFLSSPRVWNYWGRKLAGKTPRGRRRSATILFDDSEPAKRLATVEKIARALIGLGADRDATLVAVGGGVVGDVAGFVAATYLRGVRLVHVPTTLVAQVDSAFGGKTGVNLPEGKNLIGAFYPPELVIADSDVLGTLPHRQYRAGLYEIIKYGVISDPELFHFLERHMLALLRRDRGALKYTIPRCIRIKASVVAKDERESGLRQILNFGHTLGHALETATGYKRFLHGEAVGHGMIFATLLALAADRVAVEDAARIVRLILAIGPLPRIPPLSESKLRSLLLNDKKVHAGRIGWVLPAAIGKTMWGLEVPWRIVDRSFRVLPRIIDDWQRNETRFGELHRA
jgi:3-dehydroquinate synthase